MRCANLAEVTQIDAAGCWAVAPDSAIKRCHFEHAQPGTSADSDSPAGSHSSALSVHTFEKEPGHQRVHDAQVWSFSWRLNALRDCSAASKLQAALRMTSYDYPDVGWRNLDVLLHGMVEPCFDHGMGP